MIFLTATTDTLELITSAVGTVDTVISYNDINNTTSLVTPGRQNTNISTAATTTILAAPAAGVTRQVKHITISNKSASVSQTLTPQVNANTVKAVIVSAGTLAPNETLIIEDGRGVSVLDPFGKEKAANAATQSLGTAATRWYAQLSDGTNSPAIKAASTASVFTDPAMAVDVRPGGLFAVAAALADGIANFTATIIGSAAMLFNGTTWDRRHNNWNTTAADTGVKTVSFTGALQTNYDARGAFIVFNITGVSGTSPTMFMVPQYSPDGGSTWLNIAGNPVSVTANGNYEIVIYPTNISQAAGTTPATIVPSPQALIAAYNVPLARTWRINYTITGTTPSFTINAVWVNYVL